MKKFIQIAFYCLFAQLVAAQTTINPKIAPELRAAFQRGEQQDILLVMTVQANLQSAATIHGKANKAKYVFEQLQAISNSSQANVRAFLKEQKATANSFYIVNAISVKGCTGNLANLLAKFPEIRAISADPKVELNKPAFSLQPITANRDNVEWGVQKINAPLVWNLGFTGQGVTVGGADTGYDWEHPAIKPHYRGFNTVTNTADHNYNWHDAIFDKSPLNADSLNPCGFNAAQPCDDQSHGTHTMGTMTGDDGQGNQIGVAPGASWIGCRNMERGWGQPSTYIECFEWFLAPTDLTGNNPQPSKAPDVINNSWYCAVDEGCTDLTINEMMRLAVINLKASGVVVVVSNGNFGGPCDRTYGPPAYFEESFSVGSTQESDTISNFSSRGPVTIDGSNRVKPNVSAPGQFVRSCVLNGGYASYSGTSMAGPHVAGLVALIFSANPSLKGEVALIEEIVESTCLPIIGLNDCSDNNGLDYPNNTYGYGRVDALVAVQKALAVSTNDNIQTDMEVLSFPNPVLDQLYWNVTNYEGEITIKMFDTNGRMIINTQKINQNGQLLSVSLKNQPNGIYFWQLEMDGMPTKSGKIMLGK